ncbi:DEgenerin Like [Brachionus plicatilis]|uniref:DEgenerin Like n=1 Tax=Brachionus plicatilis TaxID=10195 RepID=A0A3M7P6R7_BRAPC|nr:DEgenerin Like [Brachionus plicatilis]
MEGKSNRKSIKRELKKWSKKTTISGIPKITESKSLLTKFIWTATMLVFLFIVSQKIYHLIADYFSYNVTTRIKLAFDQNITFPTITLKLINWLNYNQYKKHFRTISEFDEFIRASRSNDLKESFLISKNNFLSSYLLKDSSYSSNGHLEKEALADSLLSCYFNTVECNVTDFEFVNSPGNGALLKFVPTANKMGKFGKNSGLSLELLTGSRQSQSPVSQEVGFLVFIHDSDRTITNDDHGILLPPTAHTNIEIHKTRIKILPQPSNKCADGSESVSLVDASLYNQTRLLTGFYSKEYCFQLCYQKSVIENCGCYDERLIKYVNKNGSILSCNDKYDVSGYDKRRQKAPKYYLSYEDYLISCPSLIKEAFYSSDYVSQCSKYCPKECNYDQYSTMVSKSSYPSKAYSKVLRRNKRLKMTSGERKKIKDSILSVNIYLDSNEYTVIEEVLLISLIDLISELGDNLGLFLGLSALSTFELIDLILKLIVFVVSTMQCDTLGLRKFLKKILFLNRKKIYILNK